MLRIEIKTRLWAGFLKDKLFITVQVQNGLSFHGEIEMYSCRVEDQRVANYQKTLEEFPFK